MSFRQGSISSMSDSPKPSKTGGLAGVNAGETAICTVGKEGFGLSYRGYTIEDLAAKAGFEEVAYLLLYGHLPTRSQLTEYRTLLAELRGLPDALKTALELLPADTHPMDVLRTGCSVLGCLEPETGLTRESASPRATGSSPRSRRCCSTGISSPRTASASRRRPTTPTSPRISCTCSWANPRRNPTSARWTFRSCSTPNTSSTPRRSRCASSPPRWRIFTAPSSAASGRCADRCTAGPTRPPWS